MSPAAFLAALAEQIPLPEEGRNLIVGIDGVDGAGKTRLADDLASVLGATRDVVRVSIDGFHHPRERRHRRGRQSPEGFWLDSYDYAAFRQEVIEPFRSGLGAYLPAAHDLETDRMLDGPRFSTPTGATLLVDGIFLHREELADCWDLTVFLDVPFGVSVPRIAERDGLPADPGAAQNSRYVGGQRLYLEQCRPAERADILVDYADLARPIILRGAS
ncbi:nucleoside/nucleotide kinase family protein [Microbacterium lacusdiani]